MEIAFDFAKEQFKLSPGDTLDLHQYGVVVWLEGELAQAYKTLVRVQQERVKEVIKFVENRCNGTS